MAARITTLIDKRDNSEIIRDQIALVLLEETEHQQQLATEASKDPRLWELRVFTERSAPWEHFQTADDESLKQIAQPPIVNISFEGSTAAAAASDTFERQRYVGNYNIDCYGYGIAAESEDGHVAGDMAAAFEAQRAVRLVRNIIMAAANLWLGTPTGKNSGQFLSGRWVQSITTFRPPLDDSAAERIVGVRMVLQVDFNEFSPQVVPTVLEVVSVRLKRRETGEVYLTAQFGEE